MMLRWSVFPGTVGIIALPHSIFTPMRPLFFSLYFCLWEPAGHCTSDSTPSSMKAREIRLSSVCVHVRLCVSVWWGGEGGCYFWVRLVNRRRGGFFYVKKKNWKKKKKKPHDETPYLFSHFSNMFFCLTSFALLISFSLLCLGWPFRLFSFLSWPIA